MITNIRSETKTLTELADAAAFALITARLYVESYCDATDES